MRELRQRGRQRPAWYWREVQEERVAYWQAEEPAQPRIGQGWFDPRTHCLQIWDGGTWVCVPTD